MDRKDFFNRQKVTQAEVDSSFDDVEQGLWNLRVDNAIYGVISGLVPTLGTAPAVNITKGIAIDQLGRRVKAYTDGASTKSISYATATDTTATAVTGGNERWIMICAKFGRKRTDPRTDGLGATVYFDQDECLNSDATDAGVDKFYIVAGTMAGTGTAVKPTLPTDAIVICDIKRTPSDASNVLDTSRRMIFGPLDTAQPGTGNGAAMIMTALTTWLGGRTNPAAASLHAAIDKIITDLAATASSDDGAERIGAQASGNLSSGSVRSQLDWLDANKTGLADNISWTGTHAWSNTAQFSNIVTLLSRMRITPQTTTAAMDTAAVASAGRVLLLEVPFTSGFFSGTGGKIRIYLNNTPVVSGSPVTSLLLTFNAHWDGSLWKPDSSNSGAATNGTQSFGVEFFPTTNDTDLLGPGLCFYKAHFSDDGLTGAWNRMLDFSSSYTPAGTQLAWNVANPPTGVNIWNTFNGEYVVGMAGASNARRYYFGLRGNGAAGIAEGAVQNLGHAYTAGPSSATVTTLQNNNCSAAALVGAAAFARYFEFSTVVTADGAYNVRGYVDIYL